MKFETTVTGIAVALIVGILVLSGPIVGAVPPEQSPEKPVGDGTATVDDVEFIDSFRVTAGRFGTGVAYLRIPDVAVRLRSVTDHPRLVYRVSVPELGIETVGTRQLDPASRQATVEMSDRALTAGTIRREEYRATVSVHVQSFEVYRPIHRRNVTVEVRIDD